MLQPISHYCHADEGRYPVSLVTRFRVRP